jgi:5-methylcytosine-specific restriction enzyme A
MAFPDGITKEDVASAIQAYDRGLPHHFIDPTDYELLLQNGRRYPPKAIAGLAAERVLGRIPTPDEFSSGVG